MMWLIIIKRQLLRMSIGLRNDFHKRGNLIKNRLELQLVNAMDCCNDNAKCSPVNDILELLMLRAQKLFSYIRIYIHVEVAWREFDPSSFC